MLLRQRAIPSLDLRQKRLRKAKIIRQIILLQIIFLPKFFYINYIIHTNKKIINYLHI